MHRTVGILLAYLNLFVVVTLLLADYIAPGSDLFVGSQQLVVADYYFYYCLTDNQQWQCTKVEGVGGLPLGRSTGRDG